LTVTAALALAAAGMTYAQQKPDNTSANKPDRQQGAVTADQQGNSAADLDVTKKIRESIVRDKGLSTYAHNVKVITRDGTVTLRGPVRSDDEKKSVESKAVAVAGAGHVVNDLTVAPSSKNH
jgi:osmotically-inducible protein OsmY